MSCNLLLTKLEKKAQIYALKTFNHNNWRKTMLLKFLTKTEFSKTKTSSLVKTQNLVKTPGFSIWNFPLSVFSISVTNPQESSGLATFNEKILNGKLHFLCIVITSKKISNETFSLLNMAFLAAFQNPSVCWIFTEIDNSTFKF